MNNTDYEQLIGQIDDSTAVSLLSAVAKKWITAEPEKAIHVTRQTEGYAQREKLAIPPWVNDPSVDSKEAGRIARSALIAMIEGEDQEIASSARELVEMPKPAKAQVIDPVTGTLCLVGLILASRVKRVGADGVEFYEGVPEGLAKVLKAAKNFFGIFG